MKKYIIVLIILICACIGVITVNAFPQNSLSAQLIGEWRNQYLKIKINTYNNTDKSDVVEADTSNWEAQLQMKPIRTHFKSDKSYYSEYRNLKDSIVKIASGTWSIKGDSLTMTQSKPEKNILKLHLSIDKNIATFIGVIDFDGDGKVDDEYYGIQKKFSAKP